MSVPFAAPTGPRPSASTRPVKLVSTTLLASVLSVLLALASTELARAGAYSSAGETLGEDLVKHPPGYDGTGGTLALGVCLDPAAPDAAEIPLQKAIAVWGGLEPTTGNVSAAADVPAMQVDFFSEILRGLGLCLGLDSPADELGFARATNGANNVFERDDGDDGVPGTADDLRGDDTSRLWFRVADNDPFATTPGTVDANTYSRDPAVLPEGESFPTCATRAAAVVLAAAGTEAVMVDALGTGEARRSLAWDDAATVRYAASGVDELAGTADDYELGLAYEGRGTDCQIPIRFTADVGSAERVVCLGPAINIEANHYRPVSTRLEVSELVSWHYTDQDGLFLDGFETGDPGRWSSATGF